MKVKVYSIFDSKGEFFGTPFFMINKPSAIRVFSDMATKDDSPISKHPTDYMLYEIGDFDDVTGEITGLKPVSCGHPIINMLEVETKVSENGKQKVEIVN